MTASGVWVARGGHWWRGSTQGPAYGSSISTFGYPGPGKVYLGAAEGGNSHSLLNQRETHYGHRIGVFRTFWNDSTSLTNDAISYATTDINAGRVPWPSFKVSHSWADMATGAGDSWFQSLLSSFDGIGGGPILLTIHHEPNPNDGGQAASDYLAMYRHLKPLSDAYPQILLTPILSATSWQMHTQGLTFGDWMQADSCDVFGFDTYNEWWYQGSAAWTTVHQCFYDQAMACQALDPTKPWAVGEFGVRTDPDNPGKAAQWIQDAYDFGRNNGAIAMSYFDSGLNSPEGPWLLDASGSGESGPPWERLEKYKSLILEPSSAYIPPGGLTVS